MARNRAELAQVFHDRCNRRGDSGDAAQNSGRPATYTLEVALGHEALI
ncbi:MAG TPA: hypothetical protein VKB29_05280 [Candidatus Binataceae bacterium]|nr:hypothetical protein [Candidatus Binataceae bacterium]